MTRKYRCEFCDSEYCSKRDLRLHIVNAHSKEYLEPLREKGIVWEADLMFRCPECGRTYRTVERYAKHYLTMHRGGHS